MHGAYYDCKVVETKKLTQSPVCYQSAFCKVTEVPFLVPKCPFVTKVPHKVTKVPSKKVTKVPARYQSALCKVTKVPGRYQSAFDVAKVPFLGY